MDISLNSINKYLTSYLLPPTTENSKWKKIKEWKSSDALHVISWVPLYIPALLIWLSTTGIEIGIEKIKNKITKEPPQNATTKKMEAISAESFPPPLCGSGSHSQTNS